MTCMEKKFKMNNEKKVMKIIMSSIIEEAVAFLRDYCY